MRTYYGPRYTYYPTTDPSGPGLHTHDMYLEGPIAWTLLYRFIDSVHATVGTLRSYELRERVQSHLTRIDIPCS